MTPRIPGDWSRIVVIAATTPWDGNRFLDQHIATQLSRYIPVLYVDPPVSPVAARRNSRLAASIASPRLRLAAPGIARLTPLALPAHQRPGMKVISLALTRRAMRGALSDLGVTSVRALIVPSLNDLFGACKEELGVFYAKDDYVAGAELMRIAPVRLRRRQLAQPHAADIVVAASPVLADQFRALGHDPLLLPNGCDSDGLALTDYAATPADVTLPAPIAGFVGHLSERIDLAMLEAVAQSGHSLLIVGARQSTFELERMRQLLDRPNVQWVGAKSYDELPSYLKVIDVGLVPYTHSDFNRASFPLKLLEYLAAGRKVVSSDLPAACWLDTELITIARDPIEFADAVGRQLAQPRNEVDIAHRRAFAAQHSWESRGRSLAQALDLAASPSPAEVPVHHPAKGRL